MRNIILAAFAIVVLISGYVFIQLHPPRTLVIAAGSEGGGYYQIAEQYRTILARDGITLEIRETAGSVENASLIEQEQVEVAIVQGGIAIDASKVETIGAIFFEPMVFLAVRNTTVPANPANWKNLRINVGGQGSGTAAAFADFEIAVGLQPEANEHLELKYDEAVDAVAEGTIDMAVFVAPINAPYLTKAYLLDSIQVLPMDYIEAISRRLKYAKTVKIPAGALSLAPVVPSRPRPVMAMEARLVISPDLHPALVNRLTMAAVELHGSRGILTDGGMFPSVDGTGLVVNSAARQLVINGPSIWHDWLPYWMASQVHRMVLLLLPILFIVLPILRALPMLYAYLMRWRIWQYYPQVMALEQELTQATSESDLSRLDASLVSLSERLQQLGVPPAYRQTVYDVRLHIGLVRERIVEKRNSTQSDPTNLPGSDVAT